MKGILYGVGVGPGEPELITLKALNCIIKCDIVILPAAPKEDCHAYRSVSMVYPEISEKEIICLQFPMTKDSRERKAFHNRIYEEIMVFLEEGKKAAFLTIGDPSIYSTYAYIQQKVLQNGGNAVMISGVPSFCAAAAAAGISLGEGEEQIHILPGSIDPESTRELKGTRIYMKPGKNNGELKRILQEAEEKEGRQVYAVSDCGMEDELVTKGAERLNGGNGYLTVVIVKESGTPYTP